MTTIHSLYERCNCNHIGRGSSVVKEIFEAIKSIFDCFRSGNSSKCESPKEIPGLQCEINDVCSRMESLTTLVKDEFRENRQSFSDIYQKLDKMDNEQNETKTKIEEMSSNINKVQKGVQRELFDTLRRRRREFVFQGWISPADKREFDLIYSNYHDMGKNGLADRYYEEVMTLPESEEEWRKLNNV